MAQKLETTDRLAPPELILAPYPAYISLHSALFQHGLIGQIPLVIYAATLALPRRLRTSSGAIFLPHTSPRLFMGFELSSRSDAKVATAEKALFDLFYLATGRTRVFSSQPEPTIPRCFRWQRLKECIMLVQSPGRRTYIAERIRGLSSKGRI
jgi:hypothetical protein